MSHPLIPIPAPLADVLDTYFQTSRFAQKNFLRFNKEEILTKIERVAARYNYKLDESARSDKFKGEFKLNRASRSIRVSSKTLPMAEDWT